MSGSEEHFEGDFLGIKVCTKTARALAVETGLDIVFPAPNELLIDLDRAEDRTVLEVGLEILDENGFSPAVVYDARSRGGNQHLIVALDRPVDPVTRLLLEAALGSDRKRALLGYLAILGKQPLEEHSVFFERPVEPHVVPDNPDDDCPF